MENEPIKAGGQRADPVGEKDAPDAPLPRHYTTSFIIIALCCVGPLALPLVWKRPNASRAWKATVTVIVLLVTLLLCAILYLAIIFLIHSLRELSQLMEEM